MQPDESNDFQTHPHTHALTHTLTLTNTRAQTHTSWERYRWQLFVVRGLNH